VLAKTHINIFQGTTEHVQQLWRAFSSPATESVYGTSVFFADTSLLTPGAHSLALCKSMLASLMLHFAALTSSQPVSTASNMLLARDNALAAVLEGKLVDASLRRRLGLCFHQFFVSFLWMFAQSLLFSSPRLSGDARTERSRAATIRTAGCAARQ
jgi:hypothetical protein